MRHNEDLMNEYIITEDHKRTPIEENFADVLLGGNNNSKIRSGAFSDKNYEYDSHDFFTYLIPFLPTFLLIMI